jgi:putative Mn2+ efflux pump MntP
MIYTGFNPKVDEMPSDPSRGHSLVILSVATSLDALAVGISFAFMQINIALSCIIIAVVTFFISGIGGFSGSLLGRKFGKRMEIIGGLVLVGIGIKILIEHLS